MKSASPDNLLVYSSIIFCIAFVVIYLSIGYGLNGEIDWMQLVILVPLVWVASFYIYSFIIKKFIYERINLIYKTIHKSKLSAGNNGQRNFGRRDILNEVNMEVAGWAEEHTKEIENLRNLEVYRKEFLANVSHELKTPLFNIQGYILTLMDGAISDTEVNLGYLRKSEKNIDRLINIVQDLEIISQLESGELLLYYTKFDFISLCRDVFDMLDNKAKSKHIQLGFHENVNPDKPVMVSADRERIQQALINLVDNSIKYGNEGGRTRIGLHDMDENILVEISDNGIGIEEEHLPRLFERFYRVDKSRSRSQGGSGLGLAIVKHIIESHQQNINARSMPGVGSSFSFTIKKA